LIAIVVLSLKGRHPKGRFGAGETSLPKFPWATAGGPGNESLDVVRCRPEEAAPGMKRAQSAQLLESNAYCLVR
jgi:hypothetical protein